MEWYYELMDKLDWYFETAPTMCLFMFVMLLLLSYIVGYYRAWKQHRLFFKELDSIVYSQMNHAGKVISIKLLIEETKGEDK